jgi:hypothetical protein
LGNRPFLNTDDITDTAIEEELLELKNDLELKLRFKDSYQKFWTQQDISDRYPTLSTTVKKLILSFPISYLVERGFSAVFRLVTKDRNNLKIVERGDL